MERKVSYVLYTLHVEIWRRAVSRLKMYTNLFKEIE